MRRPRGSARVATTPTNTPYEPPVHAPPTLETIAAVVAACAGSVVGWLVDVFGPSNWPNPVFLVVPPVVGGLVWITLRARQSVSDRQALERVYQEATDWRDRYAGIFDLANEGLLVCIDGSVVLSNQAARQLFGGETARELTGKKIGDLLPDLAAAVSFGPIRRRIRGRSLGMSFALGARTLDGMPFDAEISTHLLVVGKRQVALYTLRDVTEDNDARKGYKAALRGLEARVRSLEEERGAFLVDMGAVLRASLDQMGARTEGESPAITLDRVHGEIVTLRRTLDRILDLAVIDVGALEVHAAPVDLRGVLEEALAPWNGGCDRVPQGAVYADRARLLQVLDDMLAVGARGDAAPPQVVHRLERRAGDAWWMLELRLSGTWTASQAQDLFRAFGDRTERGLALAVARPLARMMGGELSAVGAASGGARLRLRLPAWETDAAGVEAYVPPARTRRLLLLDRTAPITAMVRQVAAAASRTVAIAREVPSLAKAASDASPEHLVVDLQRVREHGLDELLEMTAYPSLDGVPVVGVGFDEGSSRGALVVLQEVLRVPVGENQLARALQRFVIEGQPVLLVAPDAPLRFVLEVMVRRQGWSVVTAASGGLAMSRILDARPSVVLIDLGSPSASGLQFLASLRLSDMFRDLPVVGFLAQDAATTHHDGLVRAAGQVMDEAPFTREHLAEQLHHAFRPLKGQTRGSELEEATRILADPDALATMILRMPGVEP